MERRTFFAAAATTAALAAAGCSKGSASELQLVEQASDFNYAAFAKLVDKASDVRQVWDCDGYHPLILGSIKNAYNAYQFGFGIQADRVAMAIALHREATGFASLRCDVDEIRGLAACSASRIRVGTRCRQISFCTLAQQPWQQWQIRTIHMGRIKMELDRSASSAAAWWYSRATMRSSRSSGHIRPAGHCTECV